MSNSAVPIPILHIKDNPRVYLMFLWFTKEASFFVSEYIFQSHRGYEHQLNAKLGRLKVVLTSEH